MSMVVLINEVLAADKRTAILSMTFTHFCSAAYKKRNREVSWTVILTLRPEY